MAVRDYLGQTSAPEFEEATFAPAKISTFGPDCRFSAVLCIEKEGFLPLLDHAQLAERYDLPHVHEGVVEHGGAPAG